MIWFLLIAGTLWASLHAYVAIRLVSPLSVRRWLRIALYTCFGLLAAMGPLGFVVRGQLRWPYDVAYLWLAWTYAGAFSILFALTAARDLGFLLVRVAARFRVAALQSGPAPLEEDRRRFLLATTGGVTFGLTGVLTYLGLRQARRVPEVVEVEVPIQGLPEELDGYHIVQLSDVHVGLTIDKDFILPIVEAVTSLRPDLIAMTGDLVDGSVDKLRDDISPFAYLRATDGVLCVTGNHEYYSGVDEWCLRFRELGLVVLNNEHTLVQRGKARLLVAGVTDYREGKRHPGHESNPEAALRGAPAHDVRVLLAHQPRSASQAKQHGFALQLSGHTHGGQYFPWNLFIGLFEPLSTGLSKVDDMWVYVSRGTCYWGPPLRTGVPAEITSLRLRRA